MVVHILGETATGHYFSTVSVFGLFFSQAVIQLLLNEFSVNN
jgi:hypothetical protein